MVRAPGADLAALSYEPTRQSETGVVLAHGYTGSKESLDVLAAYLCSKGWPCMTFDFRGHKLGASAGSMETAADGVEDLRAVIGYARMRWSSPRLVLIGHSMGGALALAISGDDPSIAGVGVLGASASVVRGFDTPAGEALMAQRGDYVEGAPAAQVLREAGELCRAASPPAGCRMLFVAARGDIVVRAESVKALAERYGEAAQFIMVDGGHMDLPIRARGHVANWLERLSGGSRVSRT